MGDPNGIGIEVILKSLRVLGNNFTIIGSKNSFEYYQNLYGMNEILGDNHFINIGDYERPLPGEKKEFASKAAVAALDKGIEMVKAGDLRALITAPLSKKLVAKTLAGFIGHTEYLAQKFNIGDYGMLGIRGRCRILFYTTHMPLKNIFDHIDAIRLKSKIVMMNKVLKTWFNVPDPLILVSGINPHTYEFSSGEDEEISKGVEMAQKDGIKVEGPIPGDTIYNKEADGYIAIYHDQGMIYLKSRPGGSNITVGLPFLRASPLHGTGFDIAGKNLADPTSMIDTINIVEEILDRI